MRFSASSESRCLRAALLLGNRTRVSTSPKKRGTTARAPVDSPSPPAALHARDDVGVQDSATEYEENTEENRQRRTQGPTRRSDRVSGAGTLSHCAAWQRTRCRINAVSTLPARPLSSPHPWTVSSRMNNASEQQYLDNAFRRRRLGRQLFRSAGYVLVPSRRPLPRQLPPY